MKNLLFLSINLVLLLLNFQPLQNSKPNAENKKATSTPSKSAYDVHLEAIEQIEQASPLKFLYLRKSYFETEGAFDDNFYASGEIANNAIVQEYKDIVIKVTYQTKTNTIIGTSKHTIYEYFEPQKRKIFSFLVNPPAECQKITLTITAATPTIDPSRLDERLRQAAERY